ncbi:MAG: hypothetical protein WBC74_00975 [Candidatus Omnitrophota bacterium]
MKAVVLIMVILILLTSTAYAEEKQPQSHIYDHRGKRDPFIPLVGVTSGKIESLEDIMSIEDVSLQGIASDSTGKKAVIINGEMVKEGGGGGRLTVKKILRNEVILAIGDEEYRLSIYESNNE